MLGRHMKIFLAGINGRRWIPMTLARLGGEQGLVETVFSKPSYLNEIQMGEECNCSLQGSLHGGVGGGTTR